MRIDKFLKVSRILKRRTVAQEACTEEKVIINGKAAPLLYHNKYAIKVSEMLQPGSNTLEVIITTSLRNMLGPHHLQIGESFMVDTLSFTREPNSLQRYVHPSVDGYCFVKLGMKDIKFLEITQ